MLAVYSPSCTKRKCLRMCHIPHKNVLRRHLNIRGKDCGVETLVVFVQSLPGCSVSRCCKTAEGICLDQALEWWVDSICLQSC